VAAPRERRSPISASARFASAASHSSSKNSSALRISVPRPCTCWSRAPWRGVCVSARTGDREGSHARRLLKRLELVDRARRAARRERCDPRDSAPQRNGGGQRAGEILLDLRSSGP